MASMFMVKNTILRVSKAGFSNPIPSLYPRKVSRVYLTSASKGLNNRYGREDAGGDEDAKAAERMREERQVYESDREAEEVEKKYKEMKGKAQDTAHNMKEKAKEGAQQASDAMHEAKENVKGNAEMARKKTGETMHDTKEWTKDTADWTADKAKEGSGKAAEAMHNVGEKAKETVKGAWETAKGATQKVKETVVGKDEDDTNLEEYMEDSLPKRPGEAHLPKSRGEARDQHLHRDGP